MLQIATKSRYGVVNPCRPRRGDLKFQISNLRSQSQISNFRFRIWDATKSKGFSRKEARVAKWQMANGKSQINRKPQMGRRSLSQKFLSQRSATLQRAEAF